MAWGRLDDRANSNAKLLALSDSGWRMWGCSLIYCQHNLTDGFIPDHAIPSFGVRARNKVKIINELCSILVPGKKSLWHRESGGYRMNDYLDWNESRVVVLAERQKTRDRIERFRQGKRNAVQNGVQNADQNDDGTRSERDSTTTTTTTTTTTPTTTPLSRKEHSKGSAPTKALLTHFDALHKKHLGSPAFLNGGKDAALVAKLCRSHGAELVQSLMTDFFETDDAFIQQAGFSVGVFYSQASKLLTQRNRHRLTPPRRPTSGRASAAETTVDTMRQSHRGRS